MKHRNHAFTLVELLVVITIIGILATIIIVSYAGVKEKARKSKARGEVSAFVVAVKMMKQDTGEYPNHLNSFCEENIVGGGGFTTEYPVSDAHVGLLQQGTFSNWHGPYMEAITEDPWGNDYKFDPDYFCGGNSAWTNGELEQACDGMPANSHVAAIMSRHNPDPASKYGLYGGGNVAALVCKHKNLNEVH